MTIPPDDRSSLAKAYHWAMRIMVVALEMVLPGIAGLWVDRRLGTGVVFLLVGMAVGCMGGFYHLLRMTKSDAGTK